jgi:uncharacterized protein (DUF849 family)
MRPASIMVAPNGGRLTKQDHPRVPETIAEIVETAVACQAAGAAALHAHVRDAAGAHVLDAGLYRELIAEMAGAAPGMEVQISTEAVGRYAPAEQMALVRAVAPKSASMAVREVLGGDEATLARFFFEAREAGVAIQHIVYAPGEIAALAGLRKRDVLPPGPVSLIFVLGHRGGADARGADLDPFLAGLAASEIAEGAKFMACAFGRQEIACLKAVAAAGGECRVGFENNFLRPDGTPLADNAESVRALAAALAEAGGPERDP